MGIQPAPTHSTVGLGIAFGATAEFDALGVFGALQIPQDATTQPVIGHFDLITVFDALAEHAVSVANTVADHW